MIEITYDFLGLWASLWTLLYPGVVLSRVWIAQMFYRSREPHEQMIPVERSRYEQLIAAEASLKTLDKVYSENANYWDSPLKKGGL